MTDSLHAMEWHKLIIPLLTVVLCPQLNVSAVVTDASQYEISFVASGKDGFQLKVKTTDGKLSQVANLYKPKIDRNKLLGNDFHFIISDVDETGRPSFQRWTPSAIDIQDAGKHLYVDPKANAIFKIEPENDSHKIKGVFKNLRVEKTGEDYKVSNITKTRTDYLTVPNQTIEPASFDTVLTDTVDALVEYVIVADFELGNVFDHNYQKILDYFVTYMWDINLRYKTLPHTRISFQLNGIVVMANRESQPFIENSRGSDGRADYYKIISDFSEWVYTNRKNLPPLDIASVLTNADTKYYGGLGHLGTACYSSGNKFYGTSVWSEGGDWILLNTAAHELGHNLGSWHDNERGCEAAQTFIMRGQSDENRFFFSSCSDKWIGDFVRSDMAACLRNQSSKSPVTSPDFDSPLAPSMADQCRRREKNKDAWITNASCLRATCNPVSGLRSYPFRPVDNSPCGTDGRCFRGKCRQRGYLFKNVGSGRCMEATNNFASRTIVQMVSCPRVGTALSRFTITEEMKGTFLKTPFIRNGNESLEKCLYTAGSDGTSVWTDDCGDRSDSWHAWDLIYLDQNTFMLKHKQTNRCAMTRNDRVESVFALSTCDSLNTYYKWIRM